MSDKEKDLVARLLKQSILTLCKETVSFNHRLEIDGIVCLTVENETHQIVIKVHEFLERSKTDDWLRQNRSYHSEFDNQQIDQKQKWSGVLKTDLFTENIHTFNNNYKTENNCKINQTFLPVNEIEAEPISLTSSDDTETEEMDLYCREINDSESFIKQEDNDSSMEQNSLSQEEASVPSAPIQKPIVNRLIAKKLIDKSKHRTAKKCPSRALSFEPEKLQEKDSETTVYQNLNTKKLPVDITCKRCEVVFSDETSFENHNLTSHNLFTCLVCYNTFTCRNNMKRHMRLHTGQKPYKCTICSESFTRKDDVKRHLMRHTYNKPYRCNICNKGYMDRKTIKNHMKKEHQRKLVHVCPTCGESFDDNLKFQEHKKNHPELRMYRCTKCNFTGSNPLMFHKHMLIHGPQKTYTCGGCNFLFNDPFRYSFHLKKHRLEPEFSSYQCCFCNHVLPTYDQFVKHEHTHVQGKRYTCSLCFKHFRYPSNLRDHMLTHEIEKTQKDYLMQPETSSFNENKVFANIPVHIDLMNKESDDDEDDDDEERNSCEYSELQTSEYLQKPKCEPNTGEYGKEYWCTECNQGFGSEIELTDHISLSHENSVTETRKSSEKEHVQNYSQQTELDLKSPKNGEDITSLQNEQMSGLKIQDGARITYALLTRGRSESLTSKRKMDVNEQQDVKSERSEVRYIIEDIDNQIPAHVQQTAFNGGSVPLVVKQEPESNDNQSEFSTPFDSQSSSVFPSTSPSFTKTTADFVSNGPVFPTNGDLSRNLGSPGRLASPSMETNSSVSRYSPPEKIKMKIRTPGFERVVTPDVLFRTKDKFTCDVCFTEFVDFESFDKHGIHLHRRYICEYCGRLFTSKPNRERHVRYHTGEKPYTCELCDQAFYRGDDLKYHRTTRHSDVKPFACNKCGMAFAWPKELEKHIRNLRH